MTIDDLLRECRDNRLLLHKCSDTHYQICGDTGPLVDCWPTTNKYRRHDALETTKAKKGAAHQAVKEAVHLINVRARDSVPAANGHAKPAAPDTAPVNSPDRGREFRHLLYLAMERLRFHGGPLNEALCGEIAKTL